MHIKIYLNMLTVSENFTTYGLSNCSQIVNQPQCVGVSCQMSCIVNDGFLRENGSTLTVARMARDSSMPFFFTHCMPRLRKLKIRLTRIALFVANWQYQIHVETCTFVSKQNHCSQTQTVYLINNIIATQTLNYPVKCSHMKWNSQSDLSLFSQSRQLTITHLYYICI